MGLRAWFGGQAEAERSGLAVFIVDGFADAFNRAQMVWQQLCEHVCHCDVGVFDHFGNVFRGVFMEKHDGGHFFCAAQVGAELVPPTCKHFQVKHSDDDAQNGGGEVVWVGIINVREEGGDGEAPVGEVERAPGSAARFLALDLRSSHKRMVFSAMSSAKKGRCSARGRETGRCVGGLVFMAMVLGSFRKNFCVPRGTQQGFDRLGKVGRIGLSRTTTHAKKAARQPGIPRLACLFFGGCYFAGAMRSRVWTSTLP